MNKVTRRRAKKMVIAKKNNSQKAKPNGYRKLLKQKV
jgi:hypothetical protein